MSVVNGVVVAMPPPEGYVVDFDNPQRQSVVAVYCVAGVGMALAFLFLAQRVYVKLHMHHSLGFDDYCVVIAWAFTVAMQGLVLNSLVKGFGAIHAWEMPITKFAEFVKYATYIQAIVYVFPTLFSKLALLLFYLKLGNRQQWYLWGVWFTIFVTVGSNVGILFSVIFACNPIRKAWDITVTEGTCINQKAVFKATAAFGIITDVLIFLIPIPMVIHLHLPRAKKAGLFFLFTIGSATVVTSIVRLQLLIANLTTADLSWPSGPIFLWICVESNLLVMCACLPTLKYFVQVVAPGLLGSHAGKSNSNSAGLNSNYRSGGLGGSVSTRPKPKRQHYHDFDDDGEYPMETVVEAGKPVDRDTTWKDQDISGDKDRDDDSAKAIIQTKTLQIHYEHRPVRE